MLSPEDLARIHADTQGILGTASGRRVNVAVMKTSACPSCDVDEVTQKSRNPTCPSCHGIGSIKTAARIQIPATVQWAPLDEYRREVAGVVASGRCTIEVAPQWQASFGVDAEVEVDGERMIVSTVSPAGIGMVNRIIVVCVRPTANHR